MLKETTIHSIVCQNFGNGLFIMVKKAILKFPLKYMKNFLIQKTRMVKRMSWQLGLNKLK